MMMTSFMMNQFQMMQQQMMGGAMPRQPSAYDSSAQQIPKMQQSMPKQPPQESFIQETNTKVIEGRFDTFDVREGQAVNKVSIRNQDNARDVDVGSYLGNRRR